MTVHGDCDPRFAAVQEEFERNFAERGEIGASVCVVLEGEPVVDLYGGVADPRSGRTWESDTINVVMSCSKGLTALCGHMLLDRGLLELDAPVAQYWPEFAAHGKQDIVVRQLFTHQSGVAHVDGTVPPGGFNDWDLMVKLIEETGPAWEPGTRVGYHGLTLGWLVGELLRRVDGRSIGTFFQEEVAQPLGLDSWIGLPPEHEHRVARARFIATDTPQVLSPQLLRALADPASLISKAMTNMGGWIPHWDTPEAHAAEIPAGGAITNARGLAGAYAPLSLGGALRGVRLVSKEAIPRMRYPLSWTDVDAVLGIRTCYTLGFAKSWPNPGVGNGITIGEDAFGTPGMGGQIGFADPTHRFSFAYTGNRQGGGGTGLDARGQSVIDAVYRTVGSPTKSPGFWVRP